MEKSSYTNIYEWEWGEVFLWTGGVHSQLPYVELQSVEALKFSKLMTDDAIKELATYLFQTSSAV